MSGRRPAQGAGTLPLFLPDSPWSPPAALPEGFIGRDEVAIDVETRDDGLARGLGSGWPWAGGYICGFSVAVAGEAVYVPLRHPESDNYPLEPALDWLKKVVASAGRVVTHSGWYDAGWLSENFRPRVWDDTLAMAVMLDEQRRSASLAAVCEELGLPGKEMGLLEEAGAAYGFGRGEVRANLWRFPARYVGPYGEADAARCLAAAAAMRPRLEAEGLLDAYRLEADLMPCVVAMRRRGIRVDLDAAVRVQKQLRDQCEGLREELRVHLGWRNFGIEGLRSPEILEKAHDQVGVDYPRTPKTNRGSFKTGKVDGWMRVHPHWLPRTIAQARKLDEFADKFIGHYILKFAQNGRVHPEIHQLRDSDNSGTRTYRFSYSDPPLQQIPKREEKLALLVREIFLPEAGEKWCSNDYHSQEYRLWVHFAALVGARRADEAVAQYLENPKIDFHQMVADWTGLPRPAAKDANFARGYGASVPKFARMIGKSEEEARAIYDQYERELPWVGEAGRVVQAVAKRRGYLKLIDGARIRFDTWIPAGYTKGNVGLPLEKATLAWPGDKLQRDHTHKGWNSLIQGSAARQTKKAMLGCWREGLVPLLQMHDELGHSVSSSANGMRVAEIMRDAVRLKVPSVTETMFGESWGSVKAGW